MKILIKKILRESEDFEWARDITSDANLPIEIGEPINKPVIRNTFKLVVDFMHGDADHYNKDEYFFKSNELDYFFKILSLFQNIRQGGYGGERHIIGLIVELGLAPNRDDAWEVMMDLIPRDVTGGDDYYPAYVRGINVTYFDDSGIERYVKVKPLQHVIKLN